jgi:hypothetical protein
MRSTLAADHLTGRDRLIRREQVGAALPGHDEGICAKADASCAWLGASQPHGSRAESPNTRQKLSTDAPHVGSRLYRIFPKHGITICAALRDALSPAHDDESVARAS